MSDNPSSILCLHYRGAIKMEYCAILALTSLFVRQALAGKRPPPRSPQRLTGGDDADGSDGADPEGDDTDRSYSLDFTIGKDVLFVIVILLFVFLAVVLVVLVCWCWRRRRPPRTRTFDPGCSTAAAHHRPCHATHVTPYGWCATEAAGSDATGRGRGGDSPLRGRRSRPECGGGAVHTIYDPGRYGCCCACSVTHYPPPLHHHHELRHDPCPWLPGDSGATVAPQASGVRRANQPISESEGGRSDADCLRARCIDQSDSLNPLSIGRLPEREITLPVGSHQRNDVTSGPDDNGQTATGESLASSHTSNQTSVPGIPCEDANVLSNSVADTVTGPMNIECPGLFQTFPAALRDLFVPGQRSERRTVAGKLVVSLARMVDSKGDVLVLDNVGISLQIPPGAVASGQRQLVTLVLNWDLGDNPLMDNRQALVSPVVYCGPHGLQLEKPCILSYKHCAFDPRMIQVLSSQTELIEQKDWQVMCSAGDNSGAVCMSTDECQVRLQHFSLFTCIQTPPPGETGKKWLQVAAFCAPLQRHVHHYQVRVYFLNKTPCALQWAIQNEARFGFRLACPERTFLMLGSGESVHLTVNYVSQGWAEEGEDSTASYYAVWHGKCPHLSFCFKRSCLLDDQHRAPQPLFSQEGRHPSMEPSKFDGRDGGRGLGGVASDTSFPARVDRHVSEINLDLSVFQDSSSNCPDRLNLLLTEVPQCSHVAGDTPLPACAPTQLLPSCDKHPISIAMPSVPTASGGKITGVVHIDPKGTAGPNVLVDFEQDNDCLPWPAFAIEEERKELQKLGRGVAPAAAKGGVVNARGTFPQELKQKLKVKLDPPCAFGNDWKLLASRLGLDKYIRWLASRDNPTLHVLQYTEAKEMTLPCLQAILVDINRPDAANDVRRAIERLQPAGVTSHPPMTSDTRPRQGRDPHVPPVSLFPEAGDRKGALAGVLGAPAAEAGEDEEKDGGRRKGALAEHFRLNAMTSPLVQQGRGRRDGILDERQRAAVTPRREEGEEHSEDASL